MIIEEKCEEILFIDLEQLRLGKQDEFEKMYNKYANKIYSYACKALPTKEDAEEIMQEVFSSIWQQRQNISSEGLIWKLVRCRCIDRLRKRKIQLIENQHLEQMYRENNVAKDLINEEQYQQVLTKISAGEREVLTLLIKGFIRQEIANILKLPIGTIDSRLHRLKNKLKGKNNDI